MNQDDAASPAPPGYRATHQSRDHAALYDRDFWSASSAKGLDWELEQRILDLIFDRHLIPRPRRVLDFACGTGRVLHYLENRADETFGVDVSPEMLALARPRCTRSVLVEHDVTVSTPLQLTGTFDLVTAFRFFLNAESSLRHDALEWVRGALDPDGHLVANFHLNPASLRGRYLRARWRGRPRTPMLTPADVDELLAANGFARIARYGYEYLPYRRDGARLLGSGIRRSVEGALLDRPALARFAGAFIVVARPA